MKIAIGGDHRGASAVKRVSAQLEREGHEVVVVGTCDETPCDYPERAYEVANEVASGRADRGILICGTGIGMSIAANKVKGIRAAVVHDEMTAELSRSHNNANVLCLSGDLLGERLIETIVAAWLRAEFEGGRHARRIRKIEAIEEGRDPASVSE
ncbi:MAG: ribose 5-phosphate isomerase B [Phycisphaeraceae bacterium]|nr:ribose 5-phosphate isomerase B [Phycisphaeraceae bacterium]